MVARLFTLLFTFLFTFALPLTSTAKSKVKHWKVCKMSNILNRTQVFISSNHSGVCQVNWPAVLNKTKQFKFKK